MTGEPVSEGMSEDGTIRFTYANGDCKNMQTNGDVHYQYEGGDVQQYCECSSAQQQSLNVWHLQRSIQKLRMVSPQHTIGCHHPSLCALVVHLCLYRMADGC